MPFFDLPIDRRQDTRTDQHVSSRRAPTRPTNPSHRGKEWLLIESWQNCPLSERLRSWRGNPRYLTLSPLAQSGGLQREYEAQFKLDLLGMMPGILVGWRDDWMARDAGEVVEVVETGLSANALATRRVVWIFVARRSNHRASMRCCTKTARPRNPFVPFTNLTYRSFEI